MRTTTKVFSFICIILATLIIAACTSVEKTSPRAPKYLYVQAADTAELRLVDRTTKNYELKLTHVHPYVIYFSNVPNQESGVLPLKSFLAVWHGRSREPQPTIFINSIKFYAVTDHKDIGAVLVLTNPTYDERKNILTYKAKAEDASTIVAANNLKLVTKIKLQHVYIFINSVGSTR